QRLMKFLLRKGNVYSTTKYWTVSHYKWLNNLHFENEILHETFNDYYSRVRVQEENLKAMDQKIQEIAKSEAFRERVGSGNPKMFSRSGLSNRNVLAQ
ncbi:transposase for insertion sequence element IS1533 family protein, partial [Leptospira interrogans serovar Australis str. 200703203]